MKQFCLKLTALLVFAFTTLSCSAQRFFQDVPSGDDVQKIYLGKAMLRMAGGSGGNFLDNPKIKDAVKSIESIEVINCDSGKSKLKAVRQACLNAVNNAQLELVTEVEDDEDLVKIYAAPDDDNDNFVNALVVLVSDSDSYVAVYIKGKIDLAAIGESMAN